MQIFATILGIAFALLPLQASSGAAPDPGNRSLPYKEAFARLVESSDEIVVTEHSYETDWHDSARSLIPNEVVYASKTLSSGQRRQFAERLRGLDDKTRDWADFCDFQPHHRLTFYSKQEKLGTMEICFICKAVESDVLKGIPPEALYRELESLVRSAGLEPDQDWKSRAKAAASLQ